MGGCTIDKATPVAWEFNLDCKVDAERTQYVELKVAAGGCPLVEPVIFESISVSWQKAQAHVQGFPAGRYAFEAVARDPDGQAVASDCQGVQLPSEQTIILQLQSASACGAGMPGDAGLTDGGYGQDGAPEVDAGLPDAALPPDGGDSCLDTTDRDADGVPNCADQCPDDSMKVTAGQCGCGISEADRDSDGTSDCVDRCPTDVNKTTPGTCGCNPKTVLLPGQKLLVNDYLCGPRDDSVRLVMESDGNLRLRVNGAQTWSRNSKSDAMGQPGTQAKMQEDGNLVIRTASGFAAWDSKTANPVYDTTSLSVNADRTITLVRQGTVIWTAP